MSQDLLDKPLQQEEAACGKRGLAVCSQYVKHSERGLLEKGCPRDTMRMTYSRGSDSTWRECGCCIVGASCVTSAKN